MARAPEFTSGVKSATKRSAQLHLLSSLGSDEQTPGERSLKHFVAASEDGHE